MANLPSAFIGALVALMIVSVVGIFAIYNLQVKLNRDQSSVTLKINELNTYVRSKPMVICENDFTLNK